MIKEISNSSENTISIGKKFSKQLAKGDVVILEGELGAGKTVFVKGILEGFGLKRNQVISPSFTIIREYTKKSLRIYHIDLYRIDKKEELFNLGYEDYFYSPEGISLIEWGSRVDNILPRFIKVKINFKGIEKREIVITKKEIEADNRGTSAKGRSASGGKRGLPRR